ncbi:MAG TPA: hypothetical protein VFV87_02280 [Pirellulaceae bacterium]|nr:hypothetical protein [Pirellulaceae bacterium]
MTDATEPITIDFRIPGTWTHPRELVQALPPGCRMTGEALILEDGTEVEFGAMEADGQFAEIFCSSCRRPPTDEELERVERYTVNVILSGSGGSLEQAHAMMRAAAAMVKAGGAGVFIDNSGLAHGGEIWLEMTEEGSSDAISFAYVAIIGNASEVWTMGMHALGLREVVMKKADCDAFDITEVIRYLARGDKPVANGHVLADLDGPQFQCIVQDSPSERLRGAMRNPFGRLKLVSVRDIGEIN